MQLVIWGLGTNGKNLIDILGKENIVAIVESNIDKIAEGYYDGIPIIGFETYLEKYENYYIVVTPMKYQEIESKLNDYNVERYFIQNRSNIRLSALFELRNKDLIGIYNLRKYTKYYIGGINLFSVLLYEYLMELGYSVQFYQNNNEKSLLLDILMKDRIVKDVCKQIKSEGSIFFQTDYRVHVDSDNIIVISPDMLNRNFYIEWSGDLKKFKNCHKGERVFIIATGPSLQMSDLDILHKCEEKTISMNFIFHAFEKTKWKPDYYVASDGNMIREFEKNKDIRKDFIGIHKFMSDNYLNFWKNDLDETYHGFRQIQDSEKIRFSNDFSEEVFSGNTVTYACIQLAAYMGFSTIYLLGCDYSFSKNFRSKNDHFYEQTAKHYTFDYEFVGKAYTAAKEYASKNNINIYNATRGGELEIFDRVDFDSLFSIETKKVKGHENIR